MNLKTLFNSCHTDIFPLGPSIIAHPLNITVNVPMDFTLNCTAVNNDDAPNSLTFYWEKNGVLLENDSMTTTYIDSNVVTSHLSVGYGMTAHRGDTFHCIATNRELEDGTRSFPAFVTLLRKWEDQNYRMVENF